jgi:hypothetical protein
VHTLRATLIAAISISSLLHCSPTAEAPVDTSICSIVRDTRAFEGRIVTVTAFLESSGRHAASLVDRTCPSTTLLLVNADADFDDSVIRLGEELLKDGRADTFERDVSARFTGVFRVSSDNGIRRRTLELMQVRDLKIVQNPKKRLSAHL